MTQRQPDSASVTLSVRAYTALLRAYPAAFRADYAEPMAQLFRDSCRRADRQGGPAVLLVLWANTLLDLARTSLEEHSAGGIHMTRSTFIKLSGWALPVGAFALFFGFLANSRPEYDPYNALSLPIDRIANASGEFLIAAGFLLCAVGMAGLLTRYGQAAGQWARYGLGLGAASAVVATAGTLISVVNPNGPVGWPMFYLGLMLMFVGLLLFGVVCVRRRLLPRWNALPLLTAIWVPTFILGTGIYEAITGGWWEAPDAITYLLFLASFGGLALIGVVLLTDSYAPAQQPPVA